MLVTTSLKQGRVNDTRALIGFLTCSYIGDFSLTSCSMRCVMTLSPTTVAPAKGEAEEFTLATEDASTLQ